MLKHRSKSLAVRKLTGISVTVAIVMTGTLAVAVVPPGSMPFGAYDPGGDFTDAPEPVIEHLFLPREDVFLPSLVEADDYARARNRALVVTVEPWTWTKSERNTPEFLRQGIANGIYDANMKAICDVLNTLESPVTLRWGHEMDDDNGQFIWAGWEPQDYIASYQRMIDICLKSARHSGHVVAAGR